MKLLNKTVWAITPEMMQTMMIAKQNNKSPEAVASQLGKEMKNTNAVSVRDGVAVIRVTGPLFRYANLFICICGATSYELFAQDFNKALKDPSVQAILLDVDSPGGEVNGCSEVADMIYKARAGTPVDLELGYQISDTQKLVITCHEVYLPKPKRSVNGPGGVECSYDFQGAKEPTLGKMITVSLVNDVEAY